MSKYQFCKGCEHISTIKLRGIHSYHVDHIDCPARFNPYEPIIDNQDKSQRNPHACPKHERFMLMEQMKKTGYKPPELVSLSPPDET
jgi:hypothetical protein